jgi:hypothetical protein
LEITIKTRRGGPLSSIDTIKFLHTEIDSFAVNHNTIIRKEIKERLLSELSSI